MDELAPVADDHDPPALLDHELHLAVAARGGHEDGAVEVADLAQLGAAGARGCAVGVEVASAVAVAARGGGRARRGSALVPGAAAAQHERAGRGPGDQRAALHAGCRTRVGADTRPRWRNLAATTPPTAPNRWPCQDTPGRRDEAGDQRGAVHGDHRQPADDVPRGAGVGAAGDQVRGEPEHHAAGADVDRVVGTRQPRAEAADDDHDHRDDRHALEAADGDRRAEDHERDRVADQVAPAPVQEGRERHADQPVGVARPDPGRVGVAADGVVDLDQPHHRDHGRDQDEAARAVLLVALHRRNATATSSRCVEASRRRPRRAPPCRCAASGCP